MADDVADVLEAFLAELEAGGAPSVEAYLRRYPDLAAELESALRALLTVAPPSATPPRQLDLAAGDARLGDYDLIRPLGEGGMGSVFLARDLDDDLVAVKVLHPHLLERTGFFRRFLLEAELGRRVRHENVVRSLGVDACNVGSDTVHYLVMEYVDGTTLREMLREMGPLPEALLREIGGQIAAGLDAIHAAGVVHRDLKPENVLITHDHRVRIMDLGVALLTNASVVLTRRGEFAGSLPYAAPEQFDATEVGPGADLYALGVLLYELATGLNPFRRDTAPATMQAHLEYEAPSLRDAHPDLAPFFALAVETLLRKNAADRFPSAAALREVLRGGEATSWWADRVADQAVVKAERPSIPVRRETELHGRDGDLAAVRAAWAEAQEGRGRVVLLEGEAGIGKTRLVDAFVRDLAPDEACVLYGSYPPTGGAGGLTDAVTAHFGPVDVKSALGPHLAAVPGLVPAFAAALCHQHPPEGATALTPDALEAALVALMRSLAGERPLVWVVDDLHFAESQSLRLVLALARAAAPHPVLLLLTTRPGLSEETLVHLGRVDGFRRRALERLGAREVVELLHDAFHSWALAEKLGGKIAYKSDGVPFFVFEMIRGLREGQFITELPDGSYVATKVVEEIDVPSAVRDLVAARLRDLDDDERNLLDVAAVLGHEFDPDLLARVWDLPPLVVLTKLAAVERRSGVIRASGRRYRFDHHQIQEVLYADLFEPLREQYHSALADAYAAREGLDDVDDAEVGGEAAAFLARHHLAGQRPDAARDILEPALDHLRSTYRPDAALHVIDAALEVPGLAEGVARVRLLTRKSRLLGQLGRPEPACLASEAALEVARTMDDPAVRAGALVSRGICLHIGARYDDATSALEEGAAVARSVGAAGTEAEALRCLSVVHGEVGRLAKAKVAASRALGLFREMGDTDGEARTLNNVGIALLRLGRYEEAERTLEEAIALSQKAGYLEHQMNATGSLGGAFALRKRFTEAAPLAKQQLELAERVGDRRVQAKAISNMTLLATCRGRLGEALVNGERLLAISREIGDRLVEETGLSLLGAIEYELGYHERAARHLRDALSLADEVGLRYQSPLSRTALARCVRDRGSPVEAIAILEEAASIHRATNAPGVLAEALLLLGQVRRDVGDKTQARAALEKAKAIADEIGPQAPDAEIACQCAFWPGGDAETARALFEERRSVLEPDCELRCLLLLWQATGDAEVLEEAWRKLQSLVEHAPEDAREAMVDRVSVHRAVADAHADAQAS